MASVFGWRAGRFSVKSSRSSSRHEPRRLKLESLEERACLSATVDVTYPRIINGGKTTNYPSVGIVGDAFGVIGSGTLIAPQYVLTAAHVVDELSATGARFQVGGVLYGSSQIFVHPGYDEGSIGDDAANDIAIVKLSQSVLGVSPSLIYRGTPVVGDKLTLVGFGESGTATRGGDGNFGVKRVGTTPIDGVTSKLITWDFDNKSESNTAPGDSGGPAFKTVGGVAYVAGVTSGGTLEGAGLGDHSFDTRVDAYATWIDAILADTTVVGKPVVSILARDYQAGETSIVKQANNGAIEISRSGPLGTPLTVPIDITGSATNGTDYTSLPSSVVIPSNQSTVVLALKPINDTAQEATETAHFAVHVSASYLIDSDFATDYVDIGDNDAPGYNDNFASRIVLSGASVQSDGTSYSATEESGEPTLSSNDGGRTLWWSWSTNVAGNVTIDTSGSDFDTLLGVFTGTKVKSLKRVAVNDDAAPELADYTSSVTFAAKVGVVYQIMVDGFRGDVGEVHLHVSLVVPAAIKGVSNPRLAARPVVSANTNSSFAADPGLNIVVGDQQKQMPPESGDGNLDSDVPAGGLTVQETVEFDETDDTSNSKETGVQVELMTMTARGASGLTSLSAREFLFGSSAW